MLTIHAFFVFYSLLSIGVLIQNPIRQRILLRGGNVPDHNKFLFGYKRNDTKEAKAYPLKSAVVDVMKHHFPSQKEK